LLSKRFGELLPFSGARKLLLIWSRKKEAARPQPMHQRTGNREKVTERADRLGIDVIRLLNIIKQNLSASAI
jgi:hypothetical protein